MSVLRRLVRRVRVRDPYERKLAAQREQPRGSLEHLGAHRGRGQPG